MSESLSDRQKAVLAADAPLLEHMAIEFVSASDGRCELACTVPAQLINAAGFAFGGVAFSLCDIASAYAVGSTDRRGVTLSTNMNYLKGAAAGDRLVAESTVVSATRRMASLRAEVRRESAEGDSELLAHGTFTFMLLEPRDARA